MTDKSRCKILKLETSNGLENDVVDSLATLHATKTVDERRRQLWIYDDTQQIKDYTKALLTMDSAINESIGKHGLVMCAIEKGPRIVRTGDGASDYQEARPGSIVILTPMTKDETPIWSSRIGEPFLKSSCVNAGSQNQVIILPDTKFRLTVPYYLMVRPVRNF